MDKAKSIQLEKALKGKNFNGYNVLSLVNNGKSAAVFKAEKQNKFFALKIFDNELVERFGHEIQIKRIEQEISLKNHGIKGLAFGKNCRIFMSDIHRYLFFGKK